MANCSSCGKKISMFRNIEECKRIYGLKGDIRCVLDRGLLRGPSCHSLRLRQCLLSKGAMQKADYAADTATL